MLLSRFAFPCALLALTLPACALAQEAGAAHGLNTGDMKFATFPNMPKCTTGAVTQGAPAKGASFIYAKASAGCAFPWHWHTPNEHLVMVSGTAQVDVKDGPSLTLRPGGFAMLPSKHVHRFKCVKACTLYVYSDTIFDIHYVDPQGQEIALDAALKQAKP